MWKKHNSKHKKAPVNPGLFLLIRDLRKHLGTAKNTILICA